MKVRPFCLPVFLGLLVASCSVSPREAPNRSRAAAASGPAVAFAQPPQDRPGLGTKWGETRRSASSVTSFVRATPDRPLVTAEIFYNDRAGIEAMAAASEFRRVWPVLRGPAASLISVGLKDQSGRFLPGLIVGDRWFVIGQESRRYSIALRNRSEVRLEAVLSVDGLDVLDGRPAAVRKRGYVIEPHRTLVVEGFPPEQRSGRGFSFQSGARILRAGKISQQSKCRGDRSRHLPRTWHFSQDRPRGAETPEGESISESLRHSA